MTLRSSQTEIAFKPTVRPFSRLNTSVMNDLEFDLENNVWFG
jgi:hypothetical protein